MKVSIKSRYGDPRYFETTNVDSIILYSAPDNSFFRAAYDKEYNYAYIDHDGGPCLSVGDKLRDYHKDLPDKVIVKIDNGKEDHEFILIVE